MVAKMNIRQATSADLDAIISIAQSVTHQDQQFWDYCFPFRHKYPHDTQYWTRRKYETYFDHDTIDFKIMLVTVSAEEFSRSKGGVGNIAGGGDNVGSNSTAEQIPVAFAVWNMTNVTKKFNTSSQDPNTPAPTPQQLHNDGRCCRRDADLEHLAILRDAMNEARTRLFSDVYEPNRVHLHILMTYPEFQRRGFGTHLVRLGLATAGEHGCAVTLFGTMMGVPLYRALGFKELEKVVMGQEGNSLGVTVVAMVWKAE